MMILSAEKRNTKSQSIRNEVYNVCGSFEQVDRNVNHFNQDISQSLLPERQNIVWPKTDSAIPIQNLCPISNAKLF